MSNIAIAPSILSADFCNLERDLKAISNADLVHVDVMDHHFVPNLTLGEPIVARICQVTDLPVDVHLMIDRPIRYVEQFCKAGADILTIHVEADTAENTRKAVLEGDNCAVEHRIGALIAVTVDNGVAGEAPHGHDLSRRLVLPRDVRQRLTNDFGH